MSKKFAAAGLLTAALCAAGTVYVYNNQKEPTQNEPADTTPKTYSKCIKENQSNEKLENCLKTVQQGYLKRIDALKNAPQVQ